MKPFQFPFAMIGICVALLGPLTSFAAEAGSPLRADGAQENFVGRSIDFLGAGPDLTTPRADGSSRHDLLWIEAQPVMGEAELDEDPGQDPSAWLPAASDWPAVARPGSGRDVGASAVEATRSGRPVRGPPVA